MTETGRHTGFDYDILLATAKKAALIISFTEYQVPWARNMYSVARGDLDVASSVTKTDERAEFAYFSIPYRREFVGLYFRMNSLHKYVIEKIEDLLKYDDIRGGAELGSTYGKRIDAVLEKLSKTW